MGTPRLNLSQFTSSKPAENSLGLRDYAGMFIRGVSGLFSAEGGLPGAGISALGEGLAQTVEPRPYNLPEIGIAAGLGAVPFGKGTSLVRGLAKGGLLGGAGTAARQQAEEGLHIPTLEDVGDIAVGTGLGVAGAGVGHAIGQLAGKIKLPEKIVNTTKAAEIVAKEEPVVAAKTVPEIKLTPKPVTTKAGAERIRTADPSVGRNIMAQIEAESKVAKSIPKLDLPQVDAQVPKTDLENVVKEKLGIHPKSSLVISLLNLPKATAASLDLSAPLRQGIFLMGRKAWWNAWKPMIQSLREGNYKEINKAIASHPRFTDALDDGLMLTTVEGIEKREEAFASDIIATNPVLRKTIGRFVIPSERAYVTFLNKLRLDVYNDLADKAAKLNIPFNGTKTASYINAATGRGSMGLSLGGRSKTLESAAPFLNTTFFSPRFIASRIQLLNPYSYVKLDPFTRREALKDLATLTGVASTVLGLAKLGGKEVTLDPSNTDFGKVKDQNTRIDLLGGFGQYIRLFSQIGKGLTTDENGPDLKRFIESKLSPSAHMALEMTSGKDYFGKDISIPKSLLNSFIPMITRDVYDLWKEDPEMLPLAGLSALGLNVQTYKEPGRRRSLDINGLPKKNPTGIPRVHLNLPR